MKKILWLVTLLVLVATSGGCADSSNSNNQAVNNAQVKQTPIQEEVIVYYSKNVTPEGMLAVYNKINKDITGKTGIKIHGGEAKINLDLWRELQRNIPNSIIVETKVATGFSGTRANAPALANSIKNQGVDFAPIDILDKDGEVLIPIKGGMHLKEIGLPRGMQAYDSFVVMTNLKMPSYSGFTGAIKNIGIGMVGPDAKMVVHEKGFPKDAGFFERLCDSTKGVTDYYGSKMVYINVLGDVRPASDLPANRGDLGIVGSTDILAVEAATMDLIYGLSIEEMQKQPMRTKIEKGFYLLEAMEKIGAGNRKYKLVSVD